MTVPVGVPAAVATLKLTVTSWPPSDGSGASEVIVVVVLAPSTRCATLADTGLRLWLASPAYLALSDFGPAVVNVIEHWPAATVPVQEWVGSEPTVTFPVGVAPMLPSFVTL